MFFFLITTRIILGLTASNFFTFWISIELNIISFICFIRTLNSKNMFSLSTLYFLPQAISSAMMMASMVILIISHSIFPKLTIMISLIIKIGLAPCHSWFIRLSLGLEKRNFFLLSTTQKILPIIFIFLFLSDVIIRAIFFSIWIRAAGSWNQNKIIIILAFSSIFSSTWVIAAFTPSLGIIYLIFYSIGLAPLLWILNKTNNVSLDQIRNFNSIYYVSFSFLIFYIIGIPPFASFLPKLYIIRELVNLKEFTLTIILISTSLIFFFIYLQITLKYLPSIFSPQVIRIAGAQGVFFVAVITAALGPWVFVL